MIEKSSVSRETAQICSVKRDIAKNLPWIRDQKYSVIREIAKILYVKRDLENVYQKSTTSLLEFEFGTNDS